MEQNSDTDFQLIGFPEIVDSGGLRSREPFEVLASQFVEEIRHGERPSIELYARRFPPHAVKIRECFPVLKLLEQARVEKETASFRHNMPERFPFSTLSQCELLCELGRGGMGIVFQARDRNSGHVVAIKVLPWRVAIVPEWQQRFEKEARTAARLRHRNIVPVFRFGLEHGYCFYVMQFVNGIGLDRIITRLRAAEGVIYQDEMRRIEEARPAGFVALSAGAVVNSEPPGSTINDDALPSPATLRSSGKLRLTRTSWPGFARIAMQAAQALRSAHASGVLHNDIKPANLLMDIEGRIWMTDFGLSQMIHAAPAGIPGNRPSAALLSLPRPPASVPAGRNSADTSTTPRLAGTLRYMAPERLLGEPADARSDLYSLGITLYELVLQQPAFPETDRESLIRSVLDDIPPAPRSINPDVPRDLETIILNCIARDPQQRYPSADVLLTDLLRFCSGDRVTSTRTGTVSDFVRSLRKRLQGTSEP